MKTVTENLREFLDSICSKVRILLTDYSSIYLWNPPSSAFIVAHNYAYRELDDAGKQLQSQILSDYRLYTSLLSVLLEGQTKKVIKKFGDTNSRIASIIEQERTTHKTTNEALDDVLQELEEQFSLLNSLHDLSEGDFLFVPDTNALLHNPSLETWTFDNVPFFKIILIPTVLSELDGLKINHRNESVRDKAEKIINQIKEYRRRGSVIQGVVLTKNVSQVKAIATEPQMDKTLSWLDSENDDDRILASAIEVMRMSPRSRVAIVSRDINLQNKAEFARISFVEPPAP